MAADRRAASLTGPSRGRLRPDPMADSPHRRRSALRSWHAHHPHEPRRPLRAGRPAHRGLLPGSARLPGQVRGPGSGRLPAGPGEPKRPRSRRVPDRAQAGPSQAGRSTVGLYHLAWEVDTLDELDRIAAKLGEAGALVGASDHGTTKALYAHDPDGLEFEVCWLVPTDQLAADVGKTQPWTWTGEGPLRWVDPRRRRGFLSCSGLEPARPTVSALQ